MSVNGITSGVTGYDTVSYTASSKEAVSEAAVTDNKNSDVAAVYEASSTETTDSAKKTYTANTELVNKLKADAEARTQQLQDIVNKLLTKQGQTYNAANGLKSMYEALEVDEATKAQAQADIAEDGYWGVKQTSERIFDFAMALTGGDPDKMNEMKDAFEKGFKQATKEWGDELPDISQRTRDAVNKLFDDYAASNSTSAAQA